MPDLARTSPRRHLPARRPGVNGIGTRLRAARQAGGLTLQQIARRTGLTPSAISQIERGLSNPSVGSLTSLAEALGATPGSLFHDGSAVGRRPALVREGARKVLSPAPGITWYLLTPDLGGRIQFMLAVYEPGAGTGDWLHGPNGEACVLVLEGRMGLRSGPRMITLRAGDSMRFERGVAHRVTNVGRRHLRAIWAITPPSF